MKISQRKVSRKISVVVDNDSWILPYADSLVKEIKKGKDSVRLCRTHEDIMSGEIAFFIGCTRIVPDSILELNQYNLVVHESDLPKGRGFSPLTWKILQGENNITVCLIEAVPEVDSGNIYLKREIEFKGHELISELRDIQGQTTIEMCLSFLNKKDMLESYKQISEPTWYRRRTPSDSKLDVNKTIAEQFDLLRVVDNDKYPAFFELNNHKYLLKIEKCDS